jgi:hypothetical protein
LSALTAVAHASACDLADPVPIQRYIDEAAEPLGGIGS